MVGMLRSANLCMIILRSKFNASRITYTNQLIRVTSGVIRGAWTPATWAKRSVYQAAICARRASSSSTRSIWATPNAALNLSMR